jgi:hypothetical protein
MSSLEGSGPLGPRRPGGPSPSDPSRPSEPEAPSLRPHPAPLSPPGPSDQYRRARPESQDGRDAFRPGQRPMANRRQPRRLGHFSSIANSASQELHSLGGLHTVVKSAANGDRPVAIHIPPRADKTRPMDLVLFFHGKGAQLDELFDQGHLAGRLREHGRAHPNTVFAFPQGHVRERYHHWMAKDRGESLARLISEVQENAARLLGVDRLVPGKLVLKAHSGGGVVFKNAIEAGELRAHRIEFLDAMYGNWGDMVAEWAKRPENAHVEFGIVYSPHQQAQVRSFRRAFSGQRPMHIERARVGHSQIPYEYWQLRPMGGR